MAVRNEDGSVTLRTRGALAYNPTGAPATALSRPAQAKNIGGGGFTQSGRLTPQKGRSTSPKSALV
jgi:hypothetical protein